MAVEAAPSTAEQEEASVQTEATTDRRQLTLLAVGHAVTDSYGNSLLAPMNPAIAQHLGLSLTQSGGLPVMMGLSASLAQPLFGWISERRPRWCLVAIGPVIAALVVGMVGHATSYLQLGLCLFLAGMGIGAFHPQAASLARRSGKGSGLAMSAFTVGGNIGYGLAPILGGFYLAWFGLSRLYLAAVPALVYAAVMMGAFSPEHEHREANRIREDTASGGKAQIPYLAVTALTATVVVRAAVQVGMMTFLPFLIQQRFPAAQQGAMEGISVSAFLLAAAFSGPLGGHLCDRWGRRGVMVWSFVLAPWPMLLALRLPGIWLILMLAVGAAILMLPHPGNVLMAQELMPRNTGIAASLITGFAQGIGHLLAMPLGHLAQVTSVTSALTFLTLVPLLGVPLVAPIPKEGSRVRS